MRGVNDFLRGRVQSPAIFTFFALLLPYLRSLESFLALFFLLWIAPITSLYYLRDTFPSLSIVKSFFKESGAVFA